MGINFSNYSQNWNYGGMPRAAQPKIDFGKTEENKNENKVTQESRAPISNMRKFKDLASLRDFINNGGGEQGEEFYIGEPGSGKGLIYKKTDNGRLEFVAADRIIII